MKIHLKLSVVLFLLMGLLVFASKLAYDFSEQKLFNDAIEEHQSQLHQSIDILIQDHHRSSGTLALSLSENPLIEALIQSPESDLNHQKISAIVARINKQKSFENLWVQLINLEGKSVYRSWTQNRGDSLLSVRPEIQQMLDKPEPKELISVGKFILSFKSMVPIFNEDERLIGIVEIITQFTPLVNELKRSQQVESVLLVDKIYEKQLSKADRLQFLDGYFVTNDGVSKEYLSWIKQLGVENLINLTSYLEQNGSVINRFILRDKSGRLLAYWLTFTPKELINFESATWVLQKYVIISIAAILLLLLVASQFISNRQTQQDKQYFRQIIDSVSDIVYITNYKKIIDSNHLFFEFYDEFEDINAFLKKYRCVCETFVEEEGFMKSYVEGEYWINYILERPHELHKAKIMRHGTAHIFQLKVKPMQGSSERLYNVLMQDITQVELYKETLRELTVTDELTGVGNRLACNQALDTEIQRSHRYHAPLSLMMLDIDHFKKVNDSYGHDVGDLVLKVVATVINAELRETDKLCRYGGEEFLVLLPESNQEAALKTAERIRLAVMNLTTEQVPTQITISIGLALLTSWDNESTLVKRADNALYQAKDLGRNRIEIEMVDGL